MRSAELNEAAWARIEPLMPQAEGRDLDRHHFFLLFGHGSSLTAPWICDRRRLPEFARILWIPANEGRDARAL